ncbi:MAG: cation diffusion facilitator family transporter, partial [Thermodesulfobacteriota bacterium]
MEEQNHIHDFSCSASARNERRTRLAVLLTAATMVLEIVAGLVFGSMALLADGFHMMSHALALSLSAIAYALSRRLASDPRFCFGTGKMGDLAGFTSALFLIGIALLMAYESVHRLLLPVTIRFDQALVVAFLGLAVNLASALLLRE